MGANGSVYLTFDDGPHPEHTPRILDVLARHGARGTFFQVGREIVRYPEVTERVVAEGHGVGNHTWSHADLSKVERSELAAEVGRTGDVLSGVVGERPVLFRPPYGRMRDTTHDDAAALGLETVLWDVDPNDWDAPGVDTIVARVLGKTEAGSIVLLHDGGGDRSQTVAALDEILSELAARGFGCPPLPRSVPSATVTS